MAPSKHVKNNFSLALKQARKSSGISQEDFSVISSRTYVSSLERGLKSPTLNKVDDLSETIDIHPLTLLSLAYLGDFNRPYFPLALVCLILALYYHYVPGQRKEYAVRHSLWHLFGALITVFCILTRVGQF